MTQQTPSILYFGPEPWEGMWRNRHHLLSRLGADRVVLYVEPRLGLKALRRMLSNGELKVWDVVKDLFRSHTVLIKDRLFVFRPPLWAPVSGRSGLRTLTLKLWAFAVRRAVKKLGLEKTDLWLARPDMSDYRHLFDYDSLTYHVVDEYLAYSGINPENIESKRTAEAEILAHADRVIVVSKALYESKRGQNANVHVVPNAVDFDAYQQAEMAHQVPEDIAHLKGPILGYSGLVSSRLDIECLIRVADVYSHCHLVFMGQVNDSKCGGELDRLRQRSNVHFVGVKPIEQVPLYVNAFSVCLIPYIKSTETDNLSPLKLYDYMALGKPIVATRFPAAMEFASNIYLADDADEFLAHIATALDEKNPTLKNARKSAAKDNSWDARVRQLSKILTNQNLQMEGLCL